MINRQIFASIILLVLLLCFSTSFVFAADIQGGTATHVVSTAGQNGTVTSMGALGGNVTAVNISSSSTTDRWTGFYGNISGTVRLSDAAGNKFFQWTVTQITGSVIYATNGTVSNWSSLAPAVYTNMPAYLQQAASDNYSTTFTLNEAFTTNLRTINSVDYAYTLNSSSENSAFKTYAMTADVNSTANDNSIMVFAGKAVLASNTFNNQAADFQIIAPARSLTTYYFYMELP